MTRECLNWCCWDVNREAVCAAMQGAVLDTEMQQVKRGRVAVQMTDSGRVTVNTTGRFTFVGGVLSSAVVPFACGLVEPLLRSFSLCKLS